MHVSIAHGPFTRWRLATACNFRNLDAPSLLHAGSHKAQGVDPTPLGRNHTGAIEFRGVHMRYRPTTPLVLHGVSFRLAAGQSVGLVGRTGSGKSSILLALFR